MAVPVTVENEVSVGKSLKSKTFGMEFNASVVKALTSTLYNYKIEAVVREYATNITDTHNDSGKVGVAGKMTVPSQLNPLIEFIDQGQGMSEEDIYNIYTVLGKSTKRGDNSTSGSLGFGAKSFVAVADQMTVTSVKDGIKTVVVCYMNKFGELTADTKSITETSESNGTKVSIPVNINDILKWQESCARVLGAFRVPHEVNSFGTQESTFKKLQTITQEVRSEGYVFTQQPDYTLKGHRSNHLVLMGDILYEIPSCSEFIGKSGIKDVATNMLDNGFYVTNFEIGDLDHAPSREAISYDKETYREVRRRVNQNLKQEYKAFQKRFGGINSNVSFYKFYHEYYKTDAWSALEDLSLPFTDGVALKYLSPAYMGGHNYVKRMFLADMGKIKGIVPYAGHCVGSTYSSSVDNFTQGRLLDITKPKIMYSEREKGVYKVTKTLENARDHYGVGSHILLCEDEKKAKKVAAWFGVSEVEVVDKYSPEKTSRKSNTSARKKFGIRSDLETVGSVMKVLGEGRSTISQQRIDLSEGGVVYFPLNGIEVKGIVPKNVTKFSGHNYFSRILEELGYSKMVFENLNNKGKIARSGIPSLTEVLKEQVIINKAALTKFCVWEYNDLRGLDEKSNLIAELKPFKKKYLSVMDSAQDVPNVVKLLAALSKWNLDKTKQYQRLTDQKKNLNDKVTMAIYKTLEKLPLADKFSCYDEKDLQSFKYYLKLEKIIK